jgi:hypothetical protein
MRDEHASIQLPSSFPDSSCEGRLDASSLRHGGGKHYHGDAVLGPNSRRQRENSARAQNPIATTISVPFQSNMYFRRGTAGEDCERLDHPACHSDQADSEVERNQSMGYSSGLCLWFHPIRARSSDLAIYGQRLGAGSGKEPVNEMTLSPFVYYNVKDGWYFVSSPAPSCQLQVQVQLLFPKRG